MRPLLLILLCLLVVFIGALSPALGQPIGQTYLAASRV